MEITINYSDMKYYSEELEALIHKVLEKGAVSRGRRDGAAGHIKDGGV